MVYLFHRLGRILFNRRNQNSVLLFRECNFGIRLISGFVVRRATRRVPHVKDDLFPLPEHLISSRFLWISCCSDLIFLCCVLFTDVCRLVVFAMTLQINFRFVSLNISLLNYKMKDINVYDLYIAVFFDKLDLPNLKKPG